MSNHRHHVSTKKRRFGVEVHRRATYADEGGSSACEHYHHSSLLSAAKCAKKCGGQVVALKWSKDGMYEMVEPLTSAEKVRVAKVMKA